MLEYLWYFNAARAGSTKYQSSTKQDYSSGDKDKSNGSVDTNSRSYVRQSCNSLWHVKDRNASDLYILWDSGLPDLQNPSGFSTNIQRIPNVKIKILLFTMPASGIYCIMLITISDFRKDLLIKLWQTRVSIHPLQEIKTLSGAW